MPKKATFQRSAFWRDSSAAAAVEFAMVAPFLVVVLINVVSFFDGFRGDRVISRTNTVVLDLLTREQGGIDDDDFDELVAIAEALAGKYVDNGFTLVLTSVRNTWDSNEDPDIDLRWSISNDSSAVLTQDDIDAMTLPSMQEGDTAIIASLTTEYTPAIVGEISGDFTLSDYLIRRPRYITEIDCSSDTGKC
ncbi:hypothetical protein [Labrenzia sp. CE80]|uniref:TadE/TadG family type IV pilus assembly protein n=1 Tax=Labrenzia sp. CE80 TaxID=1788986 RepID=UPI00129ABE0D|nr:hypothetical protein [Labrenzia sp. CE80]